MHCLPVNTMQWCDIFQFNKCTTLHTMQMHYIPKQWIQCLTIWSNTVWYNLLRFPYPLATGSESGFQYPKKWEIFLRGLLAQPFDNAEGWVGAYWVRTDLDLTWHQSWISTFTQCFCSGAFMSSAQSSLCPPPNPHFASTHWIVVFWP